MVAKVVRVRGIFALIAALALYDASAATIFFSGQLNIVDPDDPSAIYFNQQGATFTGSIDDPSGFGQITDGTTLTVFQCCGAAGGRNIGPVMPLDQDTFDLIGGLPNPPSLTLGQSIRIVDIEGDATTGGGGRIEVGLSYIFAGDAFSSGLPDENTPIDTSQALAGLFFIVEQDDAQVEIFNGLGQLTPIPVPAALLLLGSALGLGAFRYRRRAGVG